MVSGIDAAASGMISILNMSDIIANNLANVNTTAFKELIPSFKSTGVAGVKELSKDETGNIQSNIVGILSTGSMLDSTVINMKQGNLVHTGNKLDFALEGDGFFTVSNNNETYYTRNGNFKLDQEGTLLTQDGNRIVDENGSPIKIDLLKIKLDKLSVLEDGTMYAGKEKIAKIKIVSFENPSDVITVGNSLFTGLNGAKPQDATNCKISQGFIEGSNSGAIENMINTIKAARTYESLSKVIRTSETTMGRAVSDVGRVRD